jgi:hypothetical protein
MNGGFTINYKSYEVSSGKFLAECQAGIARYFMLPVAYVC